MFEMNHTKADPISAFAQGAQIRAQLQQLQLQATTQSFNQMLSFMKIQQDQSEARRRDEIGFYNAQTNRMQTEALIDQRGQPKYSDPLDQKLMQARIGSYERANQPKIVGSGGFSLPSGVYNPSDLGNMIGGGQQPGNLETTGNLFPNPNTASGMNEPSGDLAYSNRQLENDILMQEQAIIADGGTVPPDTSASPSAGSGVLRPEFQSQQQVQPTQGYSSQEAQDNLITQGRALAAKNGTALVNQGGIMSLIRNLDGVEEIAPISIGVRGLTTGSFSRIGGDKAKDKEVDPIKAQMDQLQLEKLQLEVDKAKSPEAEMNAGLKPNEKTIEEYQALRRNLALESAKPRMQGEPTDEQKVAAYTAKAGKAPSTPDEWQQAYNMVKGGVNTEEIQTQISALEEQFPALKPKPIQQAPRPTIPGAPPQSQQPRGNVIRDDPRLPPASGDGVPQAEPKRIATLDDIKTPEEVQLAYRLAQSESRVAQQNAEWTKAKQSVGSVIGKGVTMLKPETVSKAVAAMNSGNATDDDKAVMEALGIAKSIYNRDMIMDGPNSTGFFGDFSEPTGTQAAFHYAQKLGIKPQKIAGKEVAPESLLKAWAESLLTSAGLIGEAANRLPPSSIRQLDTGVVAKRK